MKNLYICLGIAICSWMFFDIWWAISPDFGIWQAPLVLLSAAVSAELVVEISLRLEERHIRKE